MSCGVCEKHRSLEALPGGVIFQDDLIFIAHFPFSESKHPHYGHLIIELKRHIVTPSEMTEAEALVVGIWNLRISQFLEKNLGAEHTYLFRIGDVTPHLHFHAVPRFSETPREMWDIYLYENRLGKKADFDDIQKISANARSFFMAKGFR